MRQYLWAGVIVMVVCANASDNPFDLKENFGKIDQDQEVLLSALKKLSEGKKSTVNTSVAPLPTVATPKAENAVQKKVVSVVETDEVEERLNQMREKAMSEENLQYQKEQKALSLSKEKEEQAQAKEVVDAEQIKKSQLEEERREVEEYERKRAEKLALKAKEEAEQKAIAEQEALKKHKAEELAVQAKEEAEKEAIALEKKAEEELKVKQEQETLVKAEDDGIVDINITREQNEAKEAADIAYIEAVKEMNQDEE